MQSKTTIMNLHLLWPIQEQLGLLPLLFIPFLPNMPCYLPDQIKNIYIDFLQLPFFSYCWNRIWYVKLGAAMTLVCWFM